MKIDNKFLIYKTVQGFNDAAIKGKIQNDSIVFVIEDRSIHTHNMEFGNNSRDKGIFIAGDKLPDAEPGDHVVIKDEDGWFLYIFNEQDGWVKTEECSMSDITSQMIDHYVAKGPLVYDQYAEFLEDLDAEIIPDDVVVYIKDKALIYGFGVYFSGGSGGGGGVPVLLNIPILYIKPTNRDADISPSLNVYTQVTELTSNKTLTVDLSNQYLHILVPTSYNITNIITSNNETLSLQDDFEAETVQIEGMIMNAYKYIPVIAPSMSLTFTFNIPQE